MDIKKYLKKLLDKWNGYEEYGGQEALSFINDIEMLLEYWKERVVNEEEKITVQVLGEEKELSKEEFEVAKQILGDPVEQSNCCGAEVGDECNGVAICMECREWSEVEYVWSN